MSPTNAFHPPPTSTMQRTGKRKRTDPPVGEEASATMTGMNDEGTPMLMDTTTDKDTCTVGCTPTAADTEVEAVVEEEEHQAPLHHPQGIKPWGNVFFDGKQREHDQLRRSGLGVLGDLTDEVIIQILGELGGADLCSLACTSKLFNCFAQLEELWRTLVVDTAPTDFDFKGSWQLTYIHAHKTNNTTEYREPKKWSVKNFYSDALYRPFFCASTPVIDAWVKLENIDRRSNLSLNDFIEQYETPNKPVIITDAAMSWPAMHKWRSREYLLRAAGEH
eukprot:GFYU01025490.1.p2 GENE.GFYU01025490.1~~GFYU01025490.1.p2  ORF type:complete len:277 (-),score=49.41 GFYU01025490.1:13-843(-)